MKGKHSATYPRFIVWAMVVAVVLVPSLSFGASTPFTENFESGTLANWTIGGRQQGTNVAEVVSRGGSQVAHLYHRYFTEITMSRGFDYDPADVYHFDLEVDTYSTGGAPSNYYGWSYLSFGFLDSADAGLGSVWYGSATTNYPFNSAASNPAVSGNAVPENVMTHYEVSVADLLSQITIDAGLIDSVRISMVTYSSTWPSPDVVAQLWVDNIELNPPTPHPVVPIPSALGLAGFGLLSLLRLRGRRVRGQAE